MLRNDRVVYQRGANPSRKHPTASNGQAGAKQTVISPACGNEAVHFWVIFLWVML